MLDEVVVAHSGLRVLLRDRVHQALVVKEQALGRLARLAGQGGELPLLQRATLTTPDEDGQSHLLLGRQQDRRVDWRHARSAVMRSQAAFTANWRSLQSSGSAALGLRGGGPSR